MTHGADYRSHGFPPFKAAVDALDKKYSYVGLRHKLAAHKSPDLNMTEAVAFWDKLTLQAVNEIGSTFSAHVFGELPKHFPHEMRTISMTGRALKSIAMHDHNEYVPFDAFER